MTRLATHLELKRALPRTFSRSWRWRGCAAGGAIDPIEAYARRATASERSGMRRRWTDVGGYRLSG